MTSRTPADRARPRPRPRAGGKPPPWYQVGPVLASATADDVLEGPGGGQGGATTADVYIFETIGGWFGMTAGDFVRDVASLDVDRIVLHLNTPGGDATEGVAIANVLRAHRAQVVVRVDGMAASAGSVIAMAGDEVVMGIGSQLMIHDAWGYAMGDAADMAAAQRMLDSTSDALAGAYATRAGGTTQQWRAVMRAESWYTPDEAVAAGLADRVAAVGETGTAEGEQVTPGGRWDLWDSLRAPERFDLSAYAYAYAGREHAPAPTMPHRGRDQQERSRVVAFSDEQLSTMRQWLGLAEDADETTITEALTEALSERAEETPPPEGVVTIDAEQLAALRACAELGSDAHARRQREDREALVAAAVGDGRIPPTRHDAWLKQLERDPGAAEVLAALAPGLIPVGAPIGHDGDGDSGAADALYAKLYGKES